VPVTVIRPEALRGTPVAGVAGGAGSAAAGDAAAGDGGGSGMQAAGDSAVAAADGDGGGLFFASSSDNGNANTTTHHHSNNSTSPAPHTFAWHRVATTAGQELRRFIAVPEGATWAELSIRAGKFDSPRLFLLRASQLAPAVRPGDTEWRTALTLSPGSEWSASFEVLGGATLELTVAQFWSSAGDSVLDNVRLEFSGVGVRTGEAEPSGAAGGGGALVLSAGAAPTRALLTSPLRRQKVRPEAKLTAVQIPLRPQPGATVEPLAADEGRDGMPLSGGGGCGGGGGQDGATTAPVYRLLLEYKLSAAEAGTYTPRFPWANRRIYDGELLAQMSWTRDGNGRAVAVDDAYPKGARLSKGGDYTVRLHLRHPSLALLESLKTAPILVERALEPAVSVPVYGSFRAAAVAAAGGGGGGNGVVKDEFLNAGDTLPIFLAPVGLASGSADDKAGLPKDAAGRVLRGHLSAGLLRRAGGGHAPARFDIVCSVPPAAAAAPGDKSKDKTNDKKKKQQSAAARVAAALRAARLQAMADLRGSSGGGGGKDGKDGAEAAEDAEAKAAREQWEALGREVGAGLEGGKGDVDDDEQDACDEGRLSLLLERLRAAVAGFVPPASAASSDKAALAAAASTRVDAAADAVIAAVDQTALAAFSALRAPDEDEEEEKEGGDNKDMAAKESEADAYRRQKKRQDAAKAALLEALKAKLAVALDEVDALSAEGEEKEGESGEGAAATAPAKERARQALSQLRRWVDTATVADYQMLHARAAFRVHRTPGLALKALDKLAAGNGDDGKPPRRDACDLRLAVLRSMGPAWAHVLRLEEAGVRAKFPGSAGQTAA